MADVHPVERQPVPPVLADRPQHRPVAADHQDQLGVLALELAELVGQRDRLRPLSVEVQANPRRTDAVNALPGRRSRAEKAVPADVGGHVGAEQVVGRAVVEQQRPDLAGRGVRRSLQHPRPRRQVGGVHPLGRLVQHREVGRLPQLPAAGPLFLEPRPAGAPADDRGQRDDVRQLHPGAVEQPGELVVRGEPVPLQVGQFDPDPRQVAEVQVGHHRPVDRQAVGGRPVRACPGREDHHLVELTGQQLGDPPVVQSGRVEAPGIDGHALHRLPRRVPGILSPGRRVAPSVYR